MQCISVRHYVTHSCLSATVPDTGNAQWLMTHKLSPAALLRIPVLPRPWAAGLCREGQLLAQRHGVTYWKTRIPNKKRIKNLSFQICLCAHIIIIFINCNWVITRWQCLIYMSANMKMVRTNMKMVNTKFKTGGLHEKHVVATWNFGNHLSICL